MDITTILVKPVFTEKSYERNLLEAKKYTFKIHSQATKLDVKRAFVAIYGIVPQSINVIVRQATKIRTGTRFPGVSQRTKYAIVTLPKGLDINVAGNQEESSSKKEKNKKEDSKE